MMPRLKKDEEVVTRGILKKELGIFKTEFRNEFRNEFVNFEERIDRKMESRFEQMNEEIKNHMEVLMENVRAEVGEPYQERLDLVAQKVDNHEQRITVLEN